MKPFAIDLNDRAVSIAREGRVLAVAPSAVFNGTSIEPSGTPAWHALRSRPIAVSTRHLGAVLSQREMFNRAPGLVADELAGRMAEHAPQAGERIWVSTPARVSVEGLGVLLAATRQLALPVDGFVDSAAVISASLAGDHGTIVLEVGLHHIAVTAVDSDAGQARRRSALVSDRTGFIELQQAWLEMISTTLVKRTRFDPLHDAATEQQLFDALPGLAAEVAERGTATAVIVKGAERFEAVLARDQFVQAAQPLYRKITGLLHQLRPAGAPIALVVPQPIAALPGLKKELEQLVGCELILVPDGFAAAATSLLDLPESSSDAPARLLRRLPLSAQQIPGEGLSRELLGRRRVGGPPPSHALVDGRAYSLDADTVVVGRAPGVQRSITVPEGLAGVSRRHCTFIRDGDEHVLLDHSSHGTFINGERVAERARVYAGDRIRLGEPGVELALIAVGEVPLAP